MLLLQKQKLSFFIIILLIFNRTGFAQNTFNSFETLYSSNGFIVSVAFKPSPNSCSGEAPVSFKYKKSGNPPSNNGYLVWSILIRDCDGQTKRKYISTDLAVFNGNSSTITQSDEDFPCKELVSGVETANVRILNQPVRRLEVIQDLASVAPSGITGPDEVFTGSTVEFKVTGGKLGSGAKWVWYKNMDTTSPAHTGETHILSDADEGMWYVRAEQQSYGLKKSTGFAYKRLIYNKGGSAPTGISGRTRACKNASVRLEVEGGATGLNGKWAWYQGSCNGTLLKRSRERFLEFEFNESCEVYVRAEPETGKPTTCFSTWITVMDKKNQDRVSLTAPNEICEGLNFNLSIKGGRTNGNIWRFYDGRCENGQIMGENSTGIFNVTNPSEGLHIYSVQAVGECEPGECASVNVLVKPLNKRPYGIDVSSNSIVKGSKFTAKPSGGFAINPDKELVWYFGPAFDKKFKIGSGENISYKPKSSGYLYLETLKNNCNTNDLYPMASREITVAKSNEKGAFFPSTQGYKRKLHYSFNLGIEIGHISDSATAFSIIGQRVDTIQKPMAYGSAFGWRLGFEFNPIYTKYVSLGLKTNFIITSAPFKMDETSLRYRVWMNELNFTAGINEVKVLCKVQNTNEAYSINTKLSNNNFARIIGKSQNSMGFGLGLRIGGAFRNDKAVKPGRALDLYYLNRSSASSFSDMMNFSSGYSAGIGIQYWVQSSNILGLEILSTKKYPGFFSNEFPDFSSGQVRLLWVAVMDQFY
jgi:hypothetical protein